MAAPRKISVGEWVAIIGLVLALTSGGITVASNFYFGATQGAVLEQKTDSHIKTDDTRHKEHSSELKEIRDEFSDMKTEQALIGKDIKYIAKRLRVKEARQPDEDTE